MNRADAPSSFDPLRPPPRRGALFTLVDGQGRLLLQHRTDDAPLHPGAWGFFGGAVEPGESVEDGLVREAAEELGGSA